MDKLKLLGETLTDQTRLKLLLILSKQKLSTTELFKKMPEISYRESIFKALKKLRALGLVDREYNEKKHGFDYFACFSSIKINANLDVKIRK